MPFRVLIFTSLASPQTAVEFYGIWAHPVQMSYVLALVQFYCFLKLQHTEKGDVLVLLSV